MAFPHHLKINIFNIPVFSRKLCHFKHFQMNPSKDNHSLSFDYTKGSLNFVHLFKDIKLSSLIGQKKKNKNNLKSSKRTL